MAFYRKTTPSSYPNTAVSNFTDSSKNWRRYANIYRKTDGNETASLTAVPGRYTDSTRTWRRIKAIYRFTGTSWVKVFSKKSQPYPLSGPFINYKGYDQSGGVHADTWIQMGPDTATWGSGTTYLWGEDGTWDQVTASRSATFVWNTIEEPNLAYTVYETTGTYNDKLENSSAALGNYDNNFIWFKVTKTTSAGSSGIGYSPASFVTKQQPTGTYAMYSPAQAQTGTAIRADYSISNLWYKSPNTINTTIEWFADASSTATLSSSNRVQGPTSVYATNVTTNNSSTYAGYDTFTPTSAHAGKYIYSRITIRNSWTDYSIPTYVVIDTKTNVTVSDVPTPTVNPSVSASPSNTKTQVYTTLTGNTGQWSTFTKSYWGWQWSDTLNGNYILIYTRNGNPISGWTYSSLNGEDTSQNQNHTLTIPYYIYDMNGTSYSTVGKYIRFYTIAQSGGATSATYNVTPIGPVNIIPSTPTNLSIVRTGNGTNSGSILAQSTWTGGDGWNYYNLQYNSSGSTWTTLATTYSTPDVYTPLSFNAPIGTYDYRVQQFSTDGFETTSASFSFTAAKILDPQAFTTISFTKGYPSSSSQGAARSTSLSWNASTNATRYEIQYQGSNDNSTWTTIQTFAASPYETATSQSKTFSTSNSPSDYYTYYRAAIRATNPDSSVQVYSDGGTAASPVYINASGTQPGNPTFGTITKPTATTASVPFTVGTEGSNFLYSTIEYQYRISSGSYSGTWSTAAISSGSGTISLSGLSSGGNLYYIKIRTRNYDNLYSSEVETYFYTPSVATSPTTVSAANNGSQTTITVDWSGASGASYYRVYWSTQSSTTQDPAVTYDKQITATNSTSGTWAWGPGNTDKNGFLPSSGSNYYFYVSSSADGSAWSAWTRSSIAVALAVPVPVNSSAPTLTPTSISVGTVLTVGAGSWTNSPTSYDLRIYRGTAGVLMSETLVASGTSSSFTYTVTQADYNSGQLYFRAYAAATNSGGTSAFTAGQERGPIAAPVSIPSGGSVTLSGTAAVGQTLTASTSGWSGSPTSYDIRIVRGTAGVIISETLKASSTTSSVSYPVASADVGYYFKAFASATNSAGTSGFASSTEKGPVPSAGVAPSTPGTPTLTYNSAGNTTGNYGYYATWTNSSTGTAPISYYLKCYGSSDSYASVQQTRGPFTTGATAQSFTLPTTSGLWKVAVYATNSYGTSSDSGLSTAQ